MLRAVQFSLRACGCPRTAERLTTRRSHELSSGSVRVPRTDRAPGDSGETTLHDRPESRPLGDTGSFYVDAVQMHSPGDPNGSAAECANWRCTVIAGFASETNPLFFPRIPLMVRGIDCTRYAPQHYSRLYALTLSLRRSKSEWGLTSVVVPDPPPPLARSESRIPAWLSAVGAIGHGTPDDLLSVANRVETPPRWSNAAPERSGGEAGLRLDQGGGLTRYGPANGRS